MLSEEQTLEQKFEERIKLIEAQAIQSFEDKLSQLKQDIDGRIGHKLKQFSHGFSDQEKRIDKVATSIFTAVDQKFIKDCELKQQIFAKMDERMNIFDKELNNKNDLNDVISTKITNLRNEFSEIAKEVKQS